MSKSGIKIFAPASVANVAVGFDILGFALDKPGDEIIVSEGTQPGLVISEITGAGGKLPYDVMKNTAGYSAYRLLEKLGETQRPIDMKIHKKMPFGSGLGSSAASAAGGVFAVNEYLRTGWSKMELLRFAVEGEQIADGAFHADNVAPSLLGGMVLIRDNESLDLKKIHIPQGLCIAVIYPHVQILTRESRGILTKEVNFKNVVTQTGNLGAFIAGMFTSDYDLISRSLHDALIEPQRAHLIPYFHDIKQIAIHTGALGFSISGAGPSMFAFCNNTAIAQEINQKAINLYQSKNIEVNTYFSAINLEGCVVC